jgi:hypothetical protein
MEGFLEARHTERFHQVVHGACVEGSHCVVIVGGDEDDGGQVGRRHAPDDLKPVEAGNLNIEEHQVGSEPGDSVDSVRTIACLPYDRDVGFAFELEPYPFSCEGLVIDDKRTDHRTPPAMVS